MNRLWVAITLIMKDNDMRNTLLILLAVAAAVSCSGNQANTKSVSGPAMGAPVTPNVEVVTAESRAVPQESVYASSVEAYAVNNIMPQSAGRIRKINAEVGDYVSKGQVLAEMDRLQLDQLALQIQNDDAEFARLKTLYQQGGLAKSDFEAAELSYAVRKTNYENVKENTILQSPITGFVTARNFDQGDMFSLSAPIFVVQQVCPVKLLVGISESEYTKVKKGDTVKLTADAIPGRTFTGKVERLYPTVDASTHTFKVEVIVPNTDKVLRPGMYARVTVDFGSLRHVIVPDNAVVRLEGTGQKFVYILNEDSTVSYIPVTLGRHLGNTYEILEGLQDGQKVVTKGQTSLKNGIKVNVL